MLRVVFRTHEEATEFRLESAHLSHQPWRPIEPPFSAAELGDIRWYIEDFLQLPVGADIQRAARIEQTLRPIGHRLFEAVFPDRNAGRLLGRVLDEGAWLEIATEPGASAAPLAWPWELLADERGFLAQRKLRVRRTVPRPGLDARARALSPKGLRVLLVVSRPDGAGMVPYDSVDAALRAVDGQPVRLDIAPAGSFAALRSCLDRAIDEGHPYDAVHFDGHGNYDPQRGAVLLFEKPATPDMTLPIDRVTPTRLGELLADKQIALVLLEACRSSTTDADARLDDPVAAGFAQGLLQHDVPAVIAMAYTVHVDATKALCAALYARLAKGHTVGEALSAARRALQTDKTRRIGFGPLPARKAIDLSDWFVPQLYATPLADRALLARDVIADAIQPPPTLPTLDPDSPIPGAFPPRPPQGVIGRLHELHRLERALHYKPAARIWGLAGMGKTTLARHATEWLLRTGRIVGAAFVDFTRAVDVEYTLTQMSAALIGGEPSTDRSAIVQWFRRHPVLVVWDNLEVLTEPAHTAEARAMQRLFDQLTGDDGGRPAAGRLLLTTRDPAQFTAAWPINLGGLWLPDARQLLDGALKRRPQPSTYAAEVHREGALALPDPTQISEARRHGPQAAPDPALVAEARERAGRQAVDALLAALGHHPLSIELVGPSLGPQRPGAIVAGLAERLAASDAEPGEEAERMRRLRAALDWSIGQLGDAAQAALPWLALFRGGVFEDNLLDVSALPPEQWAAARDDLVRTGLVRIDPAVQINNRPFLRLHPTLALLDDSGRSADPAVQARFVAVYEALTCVLDEAKRGSENEFKWALTVFGRTEPNFWRALGWANGDAAWSIQSSLLYLLINTGRRLTADRLGTRQISGKLSIEARARAAFDRLPHNSSGALRELRALVNEATHNPAIHPSHAGICFFILGRALLHLGDASQAEPYLSIAAEKFREALETQPDHHAYTGNLAAILGDLGTARNQAGDPDGAEDVLTEALSIRLACGDQRNVATASVRLAQLTSSAGRFDDALELYGRAYLSAQDLGDDALIGRIDQHIGHVLRNLEEPEKALEHYRRALDRFLRSGDRPGAMHIREALGSVWRELGDLETAKRWHLLALADAEFLTDIPCQATARHNLALVEQVEAEHAQSRGDHKAADRHLLKAERYLLGVQSLDLGSSVDKPRSAFQLGVVYRMQGRLAEARTALEEVLPIRLRAGIPTVYKDLGLLAKICSEQGDIDASDSYQARAESARALFDYNGRRHNFLVNFALQASDVRARQGMPPEWIEPTATLSGFADWLGALAGFFTALADPDAPEPTLPAGLPPDLRQTLDAVLAGADPFDALPPEVQSNPEIRALFDRSTPEPTPRPPALPPTPDLFRHLCLAFVAPEPPPMLAPTLAALARSPEPDHQAIAAHLIARRDHQPPPPLPPHLAAIAADILPD